jgi:Ca2+-binding RTX toxin-like protein
MGLVRVGTKFDRPAELANGELKVFASTQSRSLLHASSEFVVSERHTPQFQARRRSFTSIIETPRGFKIDKNYPPAYNSDSSENGFPTCPTVMIHRPRLRLEVLERRAVLASALFADGVVSITGTSGADVLRLWQDQGDLVVEGAGFRIAASQVVRIEATLAAGDDTLTNETSLPLTAWGGPDNDKLTGGSGDDVLFGEEGGDQLQGGNGQDTLWGGGQNSDTLDGGAGLDTLEGQQAIDRFAWVDGQFQLYGTPEADRIVLWRAESRWVVNGVSLPWNVNLNVFGLAGDDLIINRSNFGMTIDGGAGNDRLFGGTQNDQLVGGPGSDLMMGRGGNDTYVLGVVSEAVERDIVIESRGGQETLDFSATPNDAVVAFGGARGTLDQQDRALHYFGGSPATIRAGSGNDALTVADRAVTLLGGAGNDVLTTGSANDVLNGGAGNDVLRGGGGDDQYAFDAQAIASEEDQIVDADSSNGLKFTYGGKSFHVDLSAPVNVAVDDLRTIQRTTAGFTDFWADRGINTVKGTPGADVIRAAGTTDASYFIDGAEGDDLIEGFGTILGGPGNDRITGRGRIWGDDGNDVLIGGGTFYGGAGNDVLTGGGTFSGDDGEDVLIGGNGFDTLNGGAGDDHLEGGLQDDVLSGDEGDDVLDGGAGNDRFVFGTASPGHETDTILDTDANNGLDFRLAQNGLDVDLGASLSISITPSRTVNRDRAGFTSFIGSDGTNRIRGTAGPDVIRITGSTDSGYYIIDGLDGDDVIVGSGARNDIHGGLGNDTITGGFHDDYMWGDDGNDKIVGTGARNEIHGGAGNDTLTGGNQVNYLWGDDGNDNVGAAGKQSTIEGGAGNDVLTGGANDYIDGGAGNDVIRGDGIDRGDTYSVALFNDILIGGDGDDVIHGELGDDHIEGNAGDDVLSGGWDSDELFGGGGNDRIRGGNLQGNDGSLDSAGIFMPRDKDDILHGGDGDDDLTGSYGADQLFGDDGDDVLHGDGNDLMSP